MIETHFQVRKKDEEELQGLKDRIEKRKLVREQQIAERAIREKKRKEKECFGCHVYELWWSSSKTKQQKGQESSRQ